MSSSKTSSFRARYADAVWSENALRAPERLVALAYAKYAGARDPRTRDKADEDVSWIDWQTLSTMTGIRSRDTLSKTTQALIGAGWMEQVEPARQHRSPRYRLTIPSRPELRMIVHVDSETA